jgi:hypothetical protein
MTYDAQFYDDLIRELDLDLICQQIGLACRRAAETKRRENDGALAQAWDQYADQFTALSDKFSAW